MDILPKPHKGRLGTSSVTKLGVTAGIKISSCMRVPIQSEKYNDVGNAESFEVVH